MNILVFLKIVSQQQFADTLGDHETRLGSGSLVINPTDLYALELALRIKDRNRQTVVTVITMAPASCESELRSALAMGADHAVLVADSKMAGSDSLVTARILAEAAKKLPAQNLLLCGKKSIDSETGHIASQLAAYLHYPIATNVMDFSVEDGLSITHLSDRFVAEYKGQFPAILSICNGTEMVRKPSILGLQRSRNKSVQRFALEDLDLLPEEVGAAGSMTRVIRVETSSLARKAGNMTDDCASGARHIAEAIQKWAVQL